MGVIRKWRHLRKGVIIGEKVTDVGDFVDIRLVKDCELTQIAGIGRGKDITPKGETIRVRKSLLTEL